MMVTTTPHVTNTNRDNNNDKFPEHLQDVICGRAIIHNTGEVSWCTRKPGHDGDCRTGWQPTTQLIGHHGNQN